MPRLQVLSPVLGVQEAADQCNLPRWDQAETEHLNRWITSNKIEAVIKQKPATNKSAESDGFRVEFDHLKKN